MGEALRRHWLPVLASDVLSRQNARRVRLLGEDLVCYRDRSGVYGLIGDRCPHRGVSLEWGVAAEVGLRCPYHGWCFDASGHCVDIPLEGLITRDYVTIRAHPVEERGGMLFAYLGEGSPPELPHLPELDDPQLLRLFRFATVDGNWLDLLEGFTGRGGRRPALLRQGRPGLPPRAADDRPRRRRAHGAVQLRALGTPPGRCRCAEPRQ